MTDDISRFEAAMTNWGVCYADWTGAELLGIGDDDVVGQKVHPESGDWVVYDARGRTGVWGVHHDNWSDIHPVKLRSAKDHGLNLRLKKIPRAVPTSELMRRYIWITSHFMDWLHVDAGTPYAIWKTKDDMDAAYTAEATTFDDDPHLALYWLMHFGLCVDPRYDEVAATIRAHGHDTALDKIRWALAFFDQTGIEYEFDITPRYNPHNKDYSGLLIRRRANLIHTMHPYRYFGDGQQPDLIWASIALYRSGDPWALRRMRWFANNLIKYDLWAQMDARLNDPANDDIPLISYVRALQPGRADAGAQADAFIAALLASQHDWRPRHVPFAKVMLWEIRHLATDRAALKGAAELIFDGDITSPEYADILTELGEKPPGDDAARAALSTFEGQFDEKRSLKLKDPEERDAILAKADAELAKLDEDTLIFFAFACKKDDAQKAVLRYMMRNPSETLLPAMTNLFARATPADYHIERYFDHAYPVLVSGPNDPVFKTLIDVLLRPEEQFNGTHNQKTARRAACFFLTPSAHLPGVFEPLVRLIESPPAKDLPALLCQYIFKKRYDDPFAPLTSLDKPQMERLLSACITHLHAYPDEFKSAIGTIRDCDTPTAKDWLLAALDNQNLFIPLETHMAHFGPLDEELKRSIETALEYLEKGE